MPEEFDRGATSPADAASSPEGTTLRMLARWLQDLTLQVDEALPGLRAGSDASSTRPARARASIATTLRETAEGFAVALRHRR